MKFSMQVLCAFLLSQLPTGGAWQPNNPHTTMRQRNVLFVASQDVQTAKTQENDKEVSYVIARGDGSTGGGGLPMPKSSGEDGDGLTRPKVGAAMPEG
jgi:hypothetical protein